MLVCASRWGDFIMIGTNLLGDLVRSTVLSTKVVCDNICPPSLFLVAPFESGKTSIAIANAGEDPLVVSDMTGMGLLETLLQNQKATTVVVNDLAAVTGHRGSVSKLTIAILNGLAEEGVYKIAVPKLSYLDLKGRKVNVIACCVPDLVGDHRSWWHKSGFMSRMLVISFRHSFELRMQIHQAILNGNQDVRQGTLHIPDIPVHVTIDKEMATHIFACEELIAGKLSELGYRKHKQIRGLVAGHALLRGWKGAKVEQQDIDFLHKIIPYIVGEQLI